MSEKSFHENCYISIATIKRAELCHPVSYMTLKKLSRFFEVSLDTLMEKDTIKTESSLIQKASSLQQTTINWNLVADLANSDKHQKLSSVCEELQHLLASYMDDEKIQAIFQHNVK
ncbi:hypothetical protein [Candidatus Albibeggiatoa sp. nov. NOAA]|uniref:hypothetical protein n=1 Tax=Candidatus Albibeggiatoa sp. nov. NOAA TaxID=3162724 RepID=UPI003300FC21|nr:hypothetical protein [Thiotrichaceae bacterium]